MKEYIGILAILITFVGYFLLFLNIARGNSKPHPFTWFIWSFATGVIFLVQFLNKGGAGSWSTGVSCLLGFIVTGWSLKVKSNITIQKIDWLFLTTAMLSLPLWFVTSNPFYAILILTSVDILGYAPTIRKAHFKPFEEHLPMFAIMSLRNISSIYAMKSYNTTNLLFPIACTVANFIVIGLTLYRRRVLRNE